MASDWKQRERERAHKHLSETVVCVCVCPTALAKRGTEHSAGIQLPTRRRARTHTHRQTSSMHWSRLLLLLLMAVAPARCLLERVRGLGSQHSTHTQVLQACAFAGCGVLLGEKECWQSNKGGGGGAGAASVVVVVWEARLCSECRACVCVCDHAAPRHAKGGKERKGKAKGAQHWPSTLLGTGGLVC